MTTSNETAAREFRRLHQEGLLVLANAWDGATARLIESLGGVAVATSSAAVAWAHGYPDGDALPVRLLVATVADIARVVRVPLSVDIEGGYSDDPATAGEVVAQVIDAGGVGINIEDADKDPDLLCRKIEAARSASARLGVELFVNAHTDVYLADLAPRERRVEETLARAARYRAAGADGLFVPGVIDPGEIKTIASSVGLPLNVLARDGLPVASELESLGVRRLSAGSGIAQAAFGRIASLATAFLSTGASAPLAQELLPYAALNRLMTDR